MKRLLSCHILHKHWIIKWFGSTFSINAHVPGRNTGHTLASNYEKKMVVEANWESQSKFADSCIGQVDRLRKYGQGIKTRTHNRGCVCTPVGLNAVSHASTDWFQFKSNLRRGKQGHSSTSQTLAFLFEAWLFICSNQSLKEPKGSNWHQWRTNGWPCSEQMPVNRVVRVSNISVDNFYYQEFCSFWLFFPAVLTCILSPFQSTYCSIPKKKHPRMPSICTDCCQLLKVKL